MLASSKGDRSPWISKPTTGLSAAGTTQGTATAIPSGQDWSVFDTVAAGQGAILPAAGVSAGEEYVVSNHGANALLIYPPVGGTIGGGAVNAAYSLAAGKTGSFRNVALLSWTANP
jgi:hypothetical protein